MKIEITATARTEEGTGASRRLRGRGLTPGIVYGAGKPAQPIQLDHNALSRHLKMEAFHASILTMKVGSDVQQVLLRDVQMHPFRQMVLHVDFQRVAADQKIHMKVPLHFTSAENAPGVKFGHGIISHVLNEIDIVCLPAALPEFVEVDLSAIELGQSVHLADLKMPPGVESVQLAKGDNAVVATIQVPRGELSKEEAAPSAAAVPASAQKAPVQKAEAKPAAKPAAKK